MSRLLLQPASSAQPQLNFEKTIRRPVQLASIATFLNPDQRAELSTLYPEGNAAIWGLTPGRGTSIYPLLKRGDPALFYGSQRFYAASFLTTKMHNRPLANFLWGPQEPGISFEYVYFLADVQMTNIPLSLVAGVLGRKPNWVVMGAELLTEEATDTICEALNLFSERVPPEVSGTEYQAAIAPPRPGVPLEREVRRKMRVEQAYLRDAMFKNRPRAHCALCGEEFSVQHLVTAHIKKRTFCTPEEKLDVENIVLPMCKMGCDALFESRAIVGAGGILGVGHQDGLTPHERTLAGKLVGRTVGGYRAAMEKYFQHHAATP